MQSPLTPRYSVEIGGVKYPLRYELYDWAQASVETGVELFPPGETEFWQRFASRTTEDFKRVDAQQILDMYLLLYVGIRHAVKGLTMERLAEMVTYETLNETLGSSINAALIDFFQRLRVKAGLPEESESTPASGGSTPGLSADPSVTSPSGSSGA